MTRSYRREAWLMGVAVIGQHFMIVQAAGYPVTLGLVVGVPLILLLSRGGYARRLVLALCAVVALTASAALVTGMEGSDPLSFLRTLALFILAVIVIVAGSAGLDPGFVGSTAFSTAISAMLLIVVGLSVLQVAAGTLGSEAFFNVFGRFQYLYEYQPYLQFNPIPRAQGFFLEPSYDAFVIGTLTLISLLTGRHFRGTIAVGILGVLMSRSATGLLLLLIIGVVVALRSRPGASIVVLSGLAVVGVASGTYLQTRLESFSTSGSSTNYRLVAPLQVLGDTLLHTPIGHALGSVSNILLGYDLYNGAELGTSLDNGLYVLVFYFGWIGLVLIAALAVLAIRGMLRSRRSTWGAVTPLWLFGTLFFSGGIMLPEYAVMTALLIATLVACNESLVAPHAGTPTAPVRRRGHLPGPAGARQHAPVGAPARP
ncbi:putative colanic acid polymerase WcaD [Clavibacter nebraskensis]|uniref:Exopolysaccharide polymerase n=2 Tax=Clavibacter nebraskensis TaxID=31963 RepID=A0AAI8ZI88_9MICO|nr:putative colanic acid polymerase WcaD [Clavibacter nebraskensis]KXU20758.1 colanic acid biosynthesis protein [Clavibacter nebraskensis]OAH20553.1 colanic acid biosynthesis protein [Clavibacter nebraskensis]QGV66742.1 putative colanic acid polymerase WcaD [Clavibacter nebraskensis]QGV69540.1 putative colanic acid polymerase WcaD [Clavibacter nebraskensis]QGV72330.1 putative colanic acid polymerase WcaD [Clavibacter nebraskensis]